MRIADLAVLMAWAIAAAGAIWMLIVILFSFD
jgi:hypothetical protein